MAEKNASYRIRRDAFDRGDWDVADLAPLADGEVRLRIDRFALTSNNISYAAAGDMLDYWGFFPADEGWGHVPVMGFADVAESKHPDVAEGTRVFGFYPMAQYLTIRATSVSPAGFVDGIAHRAKHAPAYRQYSSTASDAQYQADREDQIMLLRGLFLTSFLVDSFLADSDGYGAKTYIVGSASSKTGIALAFLLSKQGRGRVVGVTSPRNRAFVERLGLYDEAIGYDEAKSLPADTPSVFVDQSGDGDFIGDLHHHLGDSLKYSCIVGATHWTANPRAQNLPGPEPTFFFAPGEIKNRVDAWGADGFQQRLGEGWRQFCDSTDAWLRISRGQGRNAVARTFQDVLAGNTRPDHGCVLSVWGADD